MNSSEYAIGGCRWEVVLRWLRLWNKIYKEYKNKTVTLKIFVYRLENLERKCQAHSNSNKFHSIEVLSGLTYCLFQQPCNIVIYLLQRKRQRNGWGQTSNATTDLHILKLGKDLGLEHDGQVHFRASKSSICWNPLYPFLFTPSLPQFLSMLLEGQLHLPV